MEATLLDRIIRLRTKFGLDVLYENNVRGYAGFIPGQDNASQDIIILSQDVNKRANPVLAEQPLLETNHTQDRLPAVSETLP